MKKNGRLLFLGTGGSLGVPVVGCSCSVCRSSLSFNKRLRPSALIKAEGASILIDSGQDFREQALRAKLGKLNGAILTHAHHDHTAGVDDLRVYQIWQDKPLTCLVSQETADDLKIRYHYMFSDNPEKGKLILHVLQEDRGRVEFCGLPFYYFPYFQAGMKVTGIRIGNLAYISDIRDYTEAIFDDLKGVEVLIISALRFTASHIHFTVDEALEFSKKVNVKKAYLTHISHDLDHEKTNAYLPEHVRVAYDGLEIPFEY